jgi:hypothetical protein
MTHGNATAQLINQRSNVGTVTTAPAPLAMQVLIPVTIPVMGKTSKKLCNGLRNRLSNIVFNIPQ